MNLHLDWCSHKAAKYAVEHWHYSKRMPKSKLVKIGVWENNVFVGVVIFGLGANKSIVNQYNLNPQQGCELVRIALNDHISSVTKIVSIAMRLLKKHCPNTLLVVSYADPEEGHVGCIYQGGNWIYTGKTSDCKFPIIDGRVAHPRTLSLRIKAGKIIRSKVKFVNKLGKHRYLFPLNKTMREQIMKISLPYPKKNISLESIDGDASHSPVRGGRFNPDLKAQPVGMSNG